ncbi:unnamed protein product [Closterium sp. NIES-65]|nr:unnamed protein product [Closterium sp. NIES-65]
MFSNATMDRRSILPGNLPSAAVIGKGLLGHEALGVDMGRFEDVGFEEMGFEEMGFDEMGFEEMGFDEMGFEGLTEGEREWTSDLAEQFAQRLGRIEENDGAGGSGVGVTAGREGVEEWEITSEEESSGSRETAGGEGVMEEEGAMEEEGGTVETRMGTVERLAMGMGPSDRYFQLPSSADSPHESRQQGGGTISVGKNGCGGQQGQHGGGAGVVVGVAARGSSSHAGMEQSLTPVGTTAQAAGQHALAAGQHALAARKHALAAGQYAVTGAQVGFMTPGEDGSLEEAKEEVEVRSMAGSALSVLPNWHANMMQYAAGMMSSSAPH